MHKLLYVSLFVFVTGCASHPVFIQPTSGPVANIEFKTDSGMNLWLMTRKTKMDKYLCSSQPSEVIAILNNRSVISKYLDGGKNTSSLNVTIPANSQEFVLLMNAVGIDTNSRIVTNCIVHQGFVPESGKNYRAIYNGDRKLCEFDFFEVNLEKQTPITTTKYPPCYIPDNSSKLMKEFSEKNYLKHPELYQ